MEHPCLLFNSLWFSIVFVLFTIFYQVETKYNFMYKFDPAPPTFDLQMLSEMFCDEFERCGGSKRVCGVNIVQWNTAEFKNICAMFHLNCLYGGSSIYIRGSWYRCEHTTRFYDEYLTPYFIDSNATHKFDEYSNTYFTKIVQTGKKALKQGNRLKALSKLKDKTKIKATLTIEV